jgi:Family of unknown function (DUF5681)
VARVGKVTSKAKTIRLHAGDSVGRTIASRGNPKAGQEIGFATRWKPGQSGNPRGYSRSRIVSQASRDLLEEIDPKTGVPYAVLVAGAQLNEALKGSTAAYNALADRTEGRPQQSIELSDGPLPTLEEVEAQIREFTERVRARQAKEREAAE